MYNAVWVTYSLALLGLVCVLQWRSRGGVDAWERRGYWLMSLPLLAFTVWRPYGAANDDYAYWLMFRKLCPIAECGQWLQSDRDLVWHTLHAGLKSFWPGTRVVLWVSAAGLLAKLMILSKLCRRPLLALLAYTVVFYPIYDLTALRISMAVTVYLLGFWLLVRCCALAGLPYLLVNGLVHKQAFASPAVLIGVLFGWRWAVFPVVLALPLVLLAGGVYPSHTLAQGLNLHVGALGLSESSLAKDLWTYFNQKQLGHYDQVRVAPLALLPLLMLAAWLARDLFEDDRRLYAYSAGSIAVAMVCLWAMAALPEVQMRFVHFFLVPVVFFFGNVRDTWAKVLPALIVVSVFIIRYGVLHPVLTTPCTLDWVKMDPVSKQRVCDVPVK